MVILAGLKAGERLFCGCRGAIVQLMFGFLLSSHHRRASYLRLAVQNSSDGCEGDRDEKSVAKYPSAISIKGTAPTYTSRPSKAAFGLFILLAISGGFQLVRCDITFNFDNECTFTVWLSASPSIGDGDPEGGPGTLELFSMPDPWTGSIWVRTKCSYDESMTNFTCETGDCGSGSLDCQSPPPKPPVTLLNFDINQNVVSYEVNLNHGFNVPVRIKPVGGSLVGGSGACPVVDCIKDLKDVCPSPLVAQNPISGVYVGCNSPCDALKDPKYCCTEGFAGQACQPNEYSKTFKQVCQLAHTYPGDNNPPIYKCSGATSYDVTFCPS
ncbi:hypothetical protein PTKIN_Ptkin13bG0259100 [Pterospermum kingtungense]